MWAGPTPPRRPSAALVLAFTALVGTTAACSDDEPEEATPAVDSTLPPVTAGPVALTELVPGDCLTGLPIGVSERIRIESAEVVSCRGGHDLEVFASFSLADREFPNTEPGAYPGQQRVVDAADQGCTDQLTALGEGSAGYGVVVVWPTAQSWASGDREVVCAAYRSDGTRFDEPTIIAG